jgi:hypothetical protein
MPAAPITWPAIDAIVSVSPPSETAPMQRALHAIPNGSRRDEQRERHGVDHVPGCSPTSRRFFWAFLRDDQLAEAITYSRVWKCSRRDLQKVRRHLATGGARPYRRHDR